MRYEDLSPKENLYFPKVSPEGNIEHPFLTQIMIINFFFFGGWGGGLNFIFPNSHDNIYLFTHQIVGQNKLIRWLEKRGE